jgi:hypothetical protein
MAADSVLLGGYHSGRGCPRASSIACSFLFVMGYEVASAGGTPSLTEDRFDESFGFLKLVAKTSRHSGSQLGSYDIVVGGLRISRHSLGFSLWVAQS